MSIVIYPVLNCTISLMTFELTKYFFKDSLINIQFFKQAKPQQIVFTVGHLKISRFYKKTSTIQGGSVI